MCIVALAWQVLEHTPICLFQIVMSFITTHTALPMVKSSDYCGQDLQSGGTWMGVTASGRWAIVTNFRDGQIKKRMTLQRCIG
jgi:uncharacterized protein with NRDE domain